MDSVAIGAFDLSFWRVKSAVPGASGKPLEILNRFITGDEFESFVIDA